MTAARHDDGPVRSAGDGSGGSGIGNDARGNMQHDTQNDAEQRLYRAISGALLSGKLRPGTALRERNLAEMFKTTRGAVRKVLALLGQEGKLDLRQNRGAFVPQPSARDVSEVYGVRKVVEAGLVAVLGAQLAGARGTAALDALTAHVAAEEAAWRRGDREESVRLAGAFHLRLAELLGNPEVTDILRRLIARTQLFVALYEAKADSHCAPDEHREIVAALAAGATERAVAAMIGHLGEVEARVLACVEAEATDDDLTGILTGLPT
ncbi:Transcriptional regulator, GntR family [Cupriavidus oxalaticus]